MDIKYIITPRIFQGDKYLSGIFLSLDHTIQSLQPRTLVENIRIDENNKLDFDSRILVLLGKNALDYLSAIQTKFPDLFTKIFVFQAQGYALPYDSIDNNVEIVYLDHPIPSIHNFDVTKNFIDSISLMKDVSYFHFIITGGTSSVLVYPEDQLTIEQYINSMKVLLIDNIDILTFNEIRSTIDSVKGGKLSQLMAKHRVHTDIISDVFTNNPSYVGSGPTVPGIILDRRSRVKLMQIAEKLSYKNSVKTLERKLVEISNYKNENHTFSILSSNKNFCNLLKRSLGQLYNEFESHIVNTEVNDDAKVFADYLLKIYDNLNPKSISIWAGELRSSIDSQLGINDKGGRLSLFAYHAALNFSSIDQVNIIAFATDGKDGSSPQSCYYINGKTYQSLLKSLQSELVSERYNMGEWFRRMGYSLETKFTNINYADIIILMKN